MIVEFIIYYLKLLALTLGVIFVCGFAVRFLAWAFSRLSGSSSGTFFDITSIIGTPVHELGHAIMCLLFGHKIVRMKLWSPSHPNGVYGYVEHSYNRKNPWARLGSLFIGVGPIFSGLGVIILMLWLCFPNQWDAYLTSSKAAFTTDATMSQILSTVFSLFANIFRGFGENWWRSLIGLIVILPISLHITLSWQDVKSAAGALPLYLLLLLIFALPTMLLNVSASITSTLWLWNVRALALFCLVIAFSAIWVLLALLVKTIQLVARSF